MNLNNIIIYCDGACSGNPGPGGWAAILIWNDRVKEISGYEAYTTNNKMELTAAIMALKEIKSSEFKISIFTDSKYVQEGITKWIYNWKKSNWKNNKVKNIDLWQTLSELSSKYQIEWHWIKGHSDNEYNNRVDSLAKSAIRSLVK